MKTKCMLFINHSVSVFVVVVMAARTNIVLIIQEGYRNAGIYYIYINARWYDCSNVLEHSITIPVHPGESGTMSREGCHLQGDLNEK